MDDQVLNLEAIRARAKVSAEAAAHDLSAPARDRLTFGQVCARWWSSAQDVRALLNAVDTMTPLLVAARNFVGGDGDKDALEALVEAADKMPWAVLAFLGVEDDDE